MIENAREVWRKVTTLLRVKSGFTRHKVEVYSE